MKQEKTIYISLDRKHVSCYQMTTIWDDQITDYVYNQKQAIISWLEENYNDVDLDHDLDMIPIWVSVNKQDWTLYNIKVVWNPEFTIEEHQEDEC